MIDMPPERLGYHELAAILRDQITSGEYQPGDTLPSEKDLQQAYGAGRPTVRRAVARLRAEGLVVTQHGFGTSVRETGYPETLYLDAGSRATARMPTRQEAKEHGIPEGVPVLVIHRRDEPDEIAPADRFALEARDRDESAAEESSGDPDQD